MKFSNFLNEWLVSTVKPIYKPRTFKKYDIIVKKQLIPNLGEYEMNLLSASVLQNFAAQLTSKYAANTVIGIMTVLKNSLERAQLTGAVDRQYSDCIQYPGREEKQVICFSVDEQRKIEQHILNHKIYKLYGVVLSLYTGLRIGELLALGWEDVDFKNGVISVSKNAADSWINGKYKKVIDTPKTISSIRMIPIPDTVLPYLKEWKKYEGKGFLVRDEYGKSVSIRSYQKTFQLFLKRLGIPHKGFHSLRHTFATRAIECGMDVKTLSEILGHKDPSITLRRYVHSLIEHKYAMMNKLGKYLQ